MRRLYLVRHGEVAVRETHYGQLDVALSPRGREQAERVAACLGSLPIDAVYSSDLQRARIGAQLVGAQVGLEPVEVPAFREMHLGLLEGVTHDESRENHPELFALTYRDLVDAPIPGGGETLREVAQRAGDALAELRARHEGETVVLVSHNSINRILLAEALGFPLEGMFDFKQSYACVNCIELKNGTTEVSLLNWTVDALAR
jgi:broad specificity phosphatase PhoE